MGTLEPDDEIALARLRLIQLAGLVDVRVRARSLFWPEVAPLLIGNMARMGRAIATLEDEFRYDATVLARSLFEHTVKFSWMAIDPATNFNRWRKSDLTNREKARNDAESVGIHEIAQVDVANNELAPLEPAPPLPEMCDAIDRHWTPEGSLLARYSFRGLYAGLYRFFSAATHAEVLAVQTLVRETPDGFVDDLAAHALGNGFTIAPVILAEALLISSVALGFPARRKVLSVFGENGAR